MSLPPWGMRFTIRSFYANMRQICSVQVGRLLYMSRIDGIRNYRLSERMKLTIYSVVFWGVLAHLYMYMNRILNNDSVHTLMYKSGTTITSGRWFLQILVEIANRFNNNYITPWGIGAVVLMIYAACACILIKTFDIKSRSLCCILGALLITYPTVTSNNLYIFTAHYYAFAFLLACGSVLLLSSFRTLPAVLGSSLLITLSLGIYQAYLPFILSMYVLLILLRCLRPEAETADIIRTALRFLAALIGGLILYFVINRCFLRLTDSAMNAYMGLDTMGRIDPASIPSILGKCYSSFFGLFREEYHGINHKPWLRIVMVLGCLFAAAAIVYLILKNRTRAVHAAFIGVAVLLLPVAIGAIYIMTQSEDAVCTMTVYATIFVFILPICMADRLQLQLTVNRAFALKACLCVALGSVCFYYSSLANETYLGLEYANQNANAYFTELAAQIKSLDGFSTEYQVALLGRIQDESVPQIECDYIIRGTDSPADLLNVYSREYFMTMHCGYSCTFAENTEALLNDERVQAMPNYPSDGSICIIDDIIVVKFSDTPH